MTSSEPARTGRPPSEDHAAAAHRPWSVRDVSIWVAVGLLAGVLSGMFGIGGGTVIVPALVFVGMTQRRAAATSLAAIVPTAIAAVITYAVDGHVDYLAALLLAVGVVGGSQVGSWLLARLPETVLRWAFVAFVGLVIVQQLLVVPSRDSLMHLTPVSGVGLVLLGVGTGVLSGILGIGGGIVVVPALSAIFGASDLVARGTSLLMMIPGAAAGTFANARKRLVDLRAGLVVGLAAAAATPLGALIARSITPRAGAIAFAIYLAALAARSVYAALHPPKGT